MAAGFTNFGFNVAQSDLGMERSMPFRTKVEKAMSEAKAAGRDISAVEKATSELTEKIAARITAAVSFTSSTNNTAKKTLLDDILGDTRAIPTLATAAADALRGFAASIGGGAGTSPAIGKAIEALDAYAADATAQVPTIEAKVNALRPGAAAAAAAANLNAFNKFNKPASGATQNFGLTANLFTTSPQPVNPFNEVAAPAPAAGSSPFNEFAAAAPAAGSNPFNEFPATAPAAATSSNKLVQTISERGAAIHAKLNSLKTTSTAQRTQLDGFITTLTALAGKIRSTGLPLSQDELSRIQKVVDSMFDSLTTKINSLTSPELTTTIGKLEAAVTALNSAQNDAVGRTPAQIQNAKSAKEAADINLGVAVEGLNKLTIRVPNGKEINQLVTLFKPILNPLVWNNDELIKKPVYSTAAAYILRYYKQNGFEIRGGKLKLKDITNVSKVVPFIRNMPVKGGKRNMRNTRKRNTRNVRKRNTRNLRKTRR